MLAARSTSLPASFVALITLGFLLVVCPPMARSQAPQPPSSAKERLGETITEVLDQTEFEGAYWGIRVVNLRTGTVLYSRNADKNFVPASNVKLFTSAAALDQLGPEYRYRTRVYVDGPVEQGTLKGNLIVRGAGDPSIGGYEQRSDPTQIFRQWADSLRARGITRIAGNVIGDDSRMDETPLGHGWSWSDISYAYAAEIGALVFNENTVDLRVEGRQVGEPGRVTWEPLQTDYVRVVNRSQTVPRRVEEDEEYQRIMGTNTIHVRTQVHANGARREAITITDPTRYFTHVLRQVLLQEGISIDGDAVDLDATGLSPRYTEDRLRQVASYRSDALEDLVRTLNHESRNLYAEQLLRTLAVESPPAVEEDLPPGSSALGVEAVRETLVHANVDTSRIQLVDGSGLSRQNLVRPNAVVRLLKYMWLHPDPEVSSAFHDSLPKGGTEGTLAYRFHVRSPARGNVQAKTGTLSNTSSLSGYVNSGRGTPIAFSVFCNHHLAESAQVRSAQDEVINSIARLPL